MRDKKKGKIFSQTVNLDISQKSAGQMRRYCAIYYMRLNFVFKYECFTSKVTVVRDPGIPKSCPTDKEEEEKM